MNGELSFFGECVLVAITLLYSLTGVVIGRRAPAWPWLHFGRDKRPVVFTRFRLSLAARSAGMTAAF